MSFCGWHFFSTDGHFISFGLYCLNARTSLKISLLRQHFSLGICDATSATVKNELTGAFAERYFISVDKSCLIARKSSAFNVAFFRVGNTLLDL